MDGAPRRLKAEVAVVFSRVLPAPSIGEERETSSSAQLEMQGASRGQTSKVRGFDKHEHNFEALACEADRLTNSWPNLPKL